MSNPIDKNQLKNIFSDVILGYSIIQDFFIPNKQIYVKHFTSLDAALINNQRDFFSLKAKSSGISNRDERIEYLKIEDFWGDKQEKEIKDQRFYLEGLRQTKSKTWRGVEVEQLNKQIAETEKKINDLLTEKENLIGFTVETYANKKINELFVQNSLFCDLNFTLRYLDKDKFNEMDDDDLSFIINDYNKKMGIFGNDNLRKIGLLDDFFSIFSLSNDNPYYLYGKPILQLTHYQIQSFQYAKNFKYILSNSKTTPPQEMLDDPDKLEEWFSLNKNTEDILEKSDGENTAATSLVGASKEDLKRMGIDSNNGPDLDKMVGKSMEELIAAHGF